MPFVIDASVAIAWSFPDEQDDFALMVVGLLREDWAIVPPIWAFEVMNTVSVAGRRGRLDEVTRRLVADRLADLDIRPIEITHGEVLGPVAELAHASGLTVYDASYVFVALREALPLATLDAGLRAAAEGAGVRVLV